MTRADYINKLHSWKNDDNAQYYEALPIETLQKFAKLGGLDTCCDLELIRPQIMAAESILEIAAGYGRVINGLINLGYRKKIVAVERCTKFYPLLQKYSNNIVNVQTVKADLRDFHSIKKFDLILWLWSGICEFSSTEQFSVLSKLSQQLTSKGILILETMPSTVLPGNAIFSLDQVAVIEEGGQGSCVYIYTPSDKQLDQYASALNLQIKHTPYLTSTKRARSLHILRPILD